MQINAIYRKSVSPWKILITVPFEGIRTKICSELKGNRLTMVNFEG